MPADNVVDKLKTRWSGEIELAPGLYVPERANVTASNWRGLDLCLEVELQDGRYRCTELHAVGQDGAEVTGELLRELPVAGIVQHAITQAAAIPRFPPAAKDFDGRTPTHKTLESVAAIYSLAYAINDGPKQRVAEHFDIATSTAGRWIARARDAKLLPPVRRDEAR